MSAALPGFDNLKPQIVVGGEILVQANGSESPVMKMQLYVGPTGNLFARPVQPPPIDQAGGRQPVPIEKRHKGVDQL